jgi:hypothetical protein
MKISALVLGYRAAHESFPRVDDLKIEVLGHKPIQEVLTIVCHGQLGGSSSLQATSNLR